MCASGANGFAVSTGAETDTTAALGGAGEAAAISFAMSEGAHTSSASNSDSSSAFAASGPALSAFWTRDLSAAARMASSAAFCAATASACFLSAVGFTRTAFTALRSTDAVGTTVAFGHGLLLMSDDAILSSVVHTAMARSAPSDRSAPFVTAS